MAIYVNKKGVNMKIQKIISRKNHEYIFEKQINDNVFLYREMITGYREYFTKFDLGLIEKKADMKYANKRK